MSKRRNVAIDPAGVQLAIDMLEQLQACASVTVSKRFKVRISTRTVDQQRSIAADYLARARCAGEAAELAFSGVLCDFLARCHLGGLPAAGDYRRLLPQG
jgi:hypothetical protein